jgi:hypothetical protein
MGSKSACPALSGTIVGLPLSMDGNRNGQKKKGSHQAAESGKSGKKHHK